jgi:mannose-6-phosphate isomerase-like protein (cupin superfamily)
MSYPPALYEGTTGEKSAQVKASGAEPDLVYPSGVRVTYLASSTATEGQFGLYRWDFSREVTGPDAHFHKTMTESFFILAGTVRLFDGDAWIDGNAGDYLFVPPGGLHGFKNESGELASMLLLFTPGAPREGYFEGLLRLNEGWSPSEQERAEFFASHDNHFG